MTLTQIRYLLAIVDAELNISLAATRVHATQPGISRQLKLLEEELGFQVFERRGKSLERTTAAGVRLIERARIILGEVRNVEAIAANHRRETRGVLRVATTQTLGRFVLPPALQRLRARFPNVQLRLHPGGEDECLAMLARDEIDLALVSTEGERPSSGLAIPLFFWNRTLVALPDHLFAVRRDPITLADVALVPLIAADVATHADYKIGRTFREHGLEPNIICTARDADTIKTFVRLGLGVGLIAEMALLKSDEDLVDLGAGHLFARCTTWAVLRSDRIQRDYLFELLRELSPGLPRDEVHRVLAGERDIELSGNVSHWRDMNPTDSSRKARI